MREIKFRVWDKQEGSMKINPILAFEMGVLHSWKYNQDMPPQFPDDGVLMQYTGIKDKNGVEIYEGDIVAYNDGELSFNAKVDCAGWEFYLDCFETNEGLGFEDLSSDRELGIIGNVYDNPELLNV